MTEGPQFRWDCSPSPSLGLGGLRTGLDCFNPSPEIIFMNSVNDLIFGRIKKGARTNDVISTRGKTVDSTPRLCESRS